LYPTKNQKTIFNHNSPNLIFYTPDSSIEKKAKTLRYGPYKDVAALEFSEVMLHYKGNYPLPIFSEVKKTIEVSHWGNINVDEYYEMWNEAAGIKGEFGRVDYQSWDPNRAQYAIKSLETDLPRYIRGLYYWDYIGNISSSNALREDDQVKFRIEPRFPVFGQWKVDWSQGYNMPTRYHLFQNNNDNRFVFNYTFDHDLADILAENYTLKVILPEGATDIKVHLPFSVDSVDHSLYFSTLDYIGRPMITMKKDNVHSSLHKQPFQVSYKMSANGLLIEPLFVIAFFFVVFVSCIMYSRMDLSFKNEKKVKSQ
jgi:oligosaccharyltransferase complex subunit alpha (ribophorin I)